MKTKEEILKEATKRTLNINEGSPLHDAVIKAMEEYAQQQVKNCFIPDISGSAFTKEDLKKAYNNGSRHGSVNGMRVARGGEMNVTTFDEWYDQHYY